MIICLSTLQWIFDKTKRNIHVITNYWGSIYREAIGEKKRGRRRTAPSETSLIYIDNDDDDDHDKLKISPVKRFTCLAIIINNKVEAD